MLATGAALCLAAAGVTAASDIVRAETASARGPMTAAEAQIRALEQSSVMRQWPGTSRRCSTSSPTYQMVNPAGQITTRAQLLALLTAGTHPYRSATYTTDVVRNLGNVIVTIGREDVVPNQGAQAGQLVHRRVTQVWVRQHGAWRLSVRQAMVVPN